MGNKSEMQSRIDEGNQQFWNELCGSTMAIKLGITDHSAKSLRRFDDAYMALYRVLKPGGHAYVMVYNKFSYRNWMMWPFATLKALLFSAKECGTSSQRGAYDADSQGRAAPETVFSSVAELQDMFGKFSSFEARKENWGGRLVRSLFLNNVAHLCGLDIYVCAQK